jgi:hypothetical protein
MDLPVELVQLLKHAGIDGQKLTWDLQVNSNAVSVKLVWIKAGKPVDKTGETTSLAQKKKHLSPSTRRRNAQRMDQWKAKREAVGDNTTCVQTQTADINPSTDETTQTDQHNSDAQAITIPTVLTKKGAIDTDKMNTDWFANKTNKIRPGRSSTHRSLSRVYTWYRYW